MISIGRALLRHSGLRQIIKFCIVGATSTVVDKGTFWLLLNKILPETPWWMSATISFCLGVTNGFIWNRHWTFRARGHGSVQSQYPKFVLSNTIGLALNLSITKLFLILFTGQFIHQVNPDKTQVFIASLCAIPFVVFWNFSAAKYWTFRAPKGNSEVHAVNAATGQRHSSPGQSETVLSAPRSKSEL